MNTKYLSDIKHEGHKICIGYKHAQDTKHIGHKTCIGHKIFIGHKT